MTRSLERAIARGEDPIAAAVYQEDRYAKAVDGSGIKAAAKLFRKPAAVLRGTP